MIINAIDDLRRIRLHDWVRVDVNGGVSYGIVHPPRMFRGYVVYAGQDCVRIETSTGSQTLGFWKGKFHYSTYLGPVAYIQKEDPPKTPLYPEFKKTTAH